MKKLILLKNLKIRSACLFDVSEIANIHLNCWKVNYKEIIDHTFLDNLKLEDRLKNRKKIIEKNACFQLVALYQNKVVGFCDAGQFYFISNQNISVKQQTNRKEPGEIYAIYVTPQLQNKGIGKALFTQGRDELVQKNLIPFIVWTLKDNHASCKFYEVLSGKQVDEIFANWGGREYRQVAYRFE